MKKMVNKFNSEYVAIFRIKYLYYYYEHLLVSRIFFNKI